MLKSIALYFDLQDNQKRFLLFSKAALKALEVLPFSPGVESLVIANDWHTAILPVLVKVWPTRKKASWHHGLCAFLEYSVPCYSSKQGRPYILLYYTAYYQHKQCCLSQCSLIDICKPFTPMHNKSSPFCRRCIKKMGS